MTTILDALSDPNLFRPHFKGDSWNAWKSFLAALYAQPQFQGQQDTYRACTGPTAPPGKSFSEAALVVGRRGGKSRVLALIAVFLGCPPSTFRMVICPEAKLRPTNSQVHNLSPPLTPIADS
jgi:hypothetical protein